MMTQEIKIMYIKETFSTAFTCHALFEINWRVLNVHIRKLSEQIPL